MHYLVIAWIKLGWQLLLALPAYGLRRMPQRMLLFLPLWLVAGLLTLMHLLGFLMDEILFRRYRSVSVSQPVFIVGVPRSGTTFLQRLLAEDARFTSLTLWECVLAPSISERYLWLFMGRLCAPVLKGLSRWRWSALDQRHSLGWTEPEEDFLLLFYCGACFLPALICPSARAYWDLAFFDQAVRAHDRQRIMTFYHDCLRRHLYFHGTEKRLLSKNPSFTPMVESLRAEFPGARFIACARDPSEALPSQLSSLAPALALAGQSSGDEAFRDRLTAVLYHYYARLNDLADTDAVWLLPLDQMPWLLEGRLGELYQFLNQSLPVEIERQLHGIGHERNRKPSHHSYQPEHFGLNNRSVRRHFSGVWPLPPLRSKRTATVDRGRA